MYAYLRTALRGTIPPVIRKNNLIRSLRIFMLAICVCGFGTELLERPGGYCSQAPAGEASSRGHGHEDSCDDDILFFRTASTLKTANDWKEPVSDSQGPRSYAVSPLSPPPKN
jgi:hypothetical protein